MMGLGPVPYAPIKIYWFVVPCVFCVSIPVGPDQISPLLKNMLSPALTTELSKVFNAVILFLGPSVMPVFGLEILPVYASFPRLWEK